MDAPKIIRAYFFRKKTLNGLLAKYIVHLWDNGTSNIRVIILGNDAELMERQGFSLLRSFKGMGLFQKDISIQKDSLCYIHHWNHEFLSRHQKQMVESNLADDIRAAIFNNISHYGGEFGGRNSAAEEICDLIGIKYTPSETND